MIAELERQLPQMNRDAAEAAKHTWLKPGCCATTVASPRNESWRDGSGRVMRPIRKHTVAGGWNKHVSYADNTRRTKASSF